MKLRLTYKCRNVTKFISKLKEFTCALHVVQLIILQIKLLVFASKRLHLPQ